MTPYFSFIISKLSFGMFPFSRWNIVGLFHGIKIDGRNFHLRRCIPKVVVLGTYSRMQTHAGRKWQENRLTVTLRWPHPFHPHPPGPLPMYPAPSSCPQPFRSTAKINTRTLALASHHFVWILHSPVPPISYSASLCRAVFFIIYRALCPSPWISNRFLPFTASRYFRIAVPRAIPKKILRGVTLCNRRSHWCFFTCEVYPNE